MCSWTGRCERARLSCLPLSFLVSVSFSPPCALCRPPSFASSSRRPVYDPPSPLPLLDLCRHPRSRCPFPRLIPPRRHLYLARISLCVSLFFFLTHFLSSLSFPSNSSSCSLIRTPSVICTK
jgi:hypothetical protein